MISTENSSPVNFSPKDSTILSQSAVPALSAAYLVWAYFSSGIRGDQIFLVALVNSCYFLHYSTRRFILGFSIFIVYWILYDSMKLFPNYWFRTVDIEGLYSTERSLFGIGQGTSLQTPNEYFLQHATPVLDVICASFYLCWVPVPLLFAFYLYRKNKLLFLRFSLAFLVTNLLGFVIYYLYPAAPPWYIQQYGNVFHPEIKSYAAGLLRFDHLVGIKLFEGLYSKGSNVFAAMPSLHSAYPLIGFYYSLKEKSKILHWIFAFVMTGIWFSAVYLGHHYILDILAGILCAFAGIFLLENVLLKKPLVQLWLTRFNKSINP